MVINALKKELIRLTLLICIVGLIFFCWQKYHNSALIQSMINLFEFSSGKLINYMGTDLIYQNSQLLSLNTATVKVLIIPELTFPFLISLFPLLYLYVRKYLLNFFVLISVVIYFIVRSAFITILFFAEKATDYQVLLNLLDSVRYIPFYLIIIYIIVNNPTLNSYYNKIKQRFDDILIFDINIVILLLILNSTPRILITLIYPELLDKLSHLILVISNFTFNTLGIETVVQSSTIHINENWIYLGHGCLGLGLLTMVIILIASTKTRILNKFIFISLLLPVQLILNSLRIDLLVIYYYYNWDLAIKPIDMHDYSNVFIYSLGFAMFLLYFFWFQDVKFGIKSTIKLNGN